MNEIEKMRSDLERLQKRIESRQQHYITEGDPVIIARTIGRKVELERAIGVIEQMQAQLNAAKRGMDSAKNAGAKMMAIGKKLAAENSPEAIESEWEANAVLTAENERLQAEVDRLSKDKRRIDAIEANCWDVRYSGDSGEDVVIEIIGNFMANPCDRVVGEDYCEDLRAAID